MNKQAPKDYIFVLLLLCLLILEIGPSVAAGKGNPADCNTDILIVKPSNNKTEATKVDETPAEKPDTHSADEVLRALVAQTWEHNGCYWRFYSDGTYEWDGVRYDLPRGAPAYPSRRGTWGLEKNSAGRYAIALGDGGVMPINWVMNDKTLIVGTLAWGQFTGEVPRGPAPKLQQSLDLQNRVNQLIRNKWSLSSAAGKTTPFSFDFNKDRSATISLKSGPLVGTWGCSGEYVWIQPVAFSTTCMDADLSFLYVLKLGRDGKVQLAFPAGGQYYSNAGTTAGVSGAIHCTMDPEKTPLELSKSWCVDVDKLPKRGAISLNGNKLWFQLEYDYPIRSGVVNPATFMFGVPRVTVGELIGPLQVQKLIFSQVDTSGRKHELARLDLPNRSFAPNSPEKFQLPLKFFGPGKTKLIIDAAFSSRKADLSFQRVEVPVHVE